MLSEESLYIKNKNEKLFILFLFVKIKQHITPFIQYLEKLQKLTLCVFNFKLNILMHLAAFIVMPNTPKIANCFLFKTPFVMIMRCENIVLFLEC